MTELAKKLIARDHRISITILIVKFPLTPEVNDRIQSLAASVAGIRFVDLPQLDLPSPDTFQTREAMVSLFLESHKPYVKNTITQLFFTPESSDSKPARLAGLFIDVVCTPMIDVANELGIPAYIFFASSACMLGVFLHLPVLDTNIQSDFKDSKTEFTIPGFNNPVPPQVLPMPFWSKKQDGFPWFVYHGRRFREAKGIIVNTFTELEPHAVHSLSLDGANPPVYPVGPLLDLQGLIHSESDQTIIKTWLDDQPSSSVVFLCFGSMGSFSALQVKEIAIGLERSGHRFLWSLRQPPQEGKFSPTAYTNFEEILPEGFLNRTAGRAWPLYGEQHLNAFEMVKELGGLVVELSLDYRGGDDLVKAEDVERAIGCLMDSDCLVRKKVKEMEEKSKMVLMDGGSSFNSLGSLILDLMDES
ncbi:hypothetical protein NE237_031869 [Protea cynaroides]|uniref:Uncharacterized protein n=1 Tax=Protea cynaroides TaxID=273540 RepID=A0A9Q0L286_9MAGN|nr:hypothetical protein NE237_031869 [Protea cynaroides]